MLANGKLRVRPFVHAPYVAARRIPNGKRPISAVALPAGVTVSQLTILQRAAQTASVPVDVVESTLQSLEAAVGSSRDQDKLASVPGRWRLVFSTGSSIAAFKYIPIKEDFVVDLDKKTVALESELGPFQFHVKGVLQSWNAATGELGFQFNQGLSIFFQGKEVYEVKPKNTSPKTYTFFFIDSMFTAARSSTGSLNLMCRLPQA